VTDAIPIIKGTLDLLVLKAVEDRAMHGFEVTAWLEQGSDGGLEFDDSAIYHSLYRLHRRGLLKSKWGVTENSRKARYYAISPAGRRHLAEETERLMRYTETLAEILRPAGPAA
jgi:PadR family transcriptional regulator, regulatory protein PadR